MIGGRAIAMTLAALVGAWSGQGLGHFFFQGGGHGIAALIAQACVPCAPGCFDSNGCEAGNTGSACGANGQQCVPCGPGQTCHNQACCTLNTCAAAGANCDSIPDGCGGSISCGSCGGTQVCTNNQCVTPPFDCSTCNCGCNGTQTACFVGTCHFNTVWDDSVCACTG
jgi:hypothetical protein